MSAGLRRARLFIAGEWADGVDTVPVYDKFTGALLGQADRASRAQVDAAVQAALRSFETTSLDPYARYGALRRACDLIEQRRDELAQTIVAEAGFPITDARIEVDRAVQTILVAAEEGKRIVGEVVPIGAAPGHSHRTAFTIRVPRGVVCGITSFNSPLNFVAHKAAPALASGNTLVLKAPQATPFSAALLFEIFLEAGIPPGHINLVQGPGRDVGRWLIEHPAIRFYTFTGSTEVGKALHKSVGLRRVALELGSVAGTIVCADGDLERAVPRIASSAFKRAGQTCTSTQRLFVHDSIVEPFQAQFVGATAQLKVGDPYDEATVVGPMISEAEAARAEQWVSDAVSAGARLLTGGTRSGAVFAPTILANVPRGQRVLCQEIFAPVVSIIPFHTLDEAIDQINATEFGLAAGIFTRDITTAMHAARSIHVGVVHINESSSSRVDLIPFAGVKDSGIGREGPKYAMQEMTEERLITISV